MTASSDAPRKLLSHAEAVILAPLGAILGSAKERDETAARAKELLTERCSRAKVLGELSVAFGLKTIKDTLRREPQVEPVVSDAAPAQSKPKPAPSVDDLIEDYDSLSASQVVGLLESLHVEERDRIGAYEASHRARRTILGKIKALERRIHS